MTDLTDLTLAAMATGLRARAFSAVELAKAHIAAVEAARPLNAFIVETPEHARAAAVAADADLAAGTAKPLAGIPLGIKDLFATEGVQTTAGSKILEGFVPQYESTVTATAVRRRARGCSASSTWTSSRWGRRTRRARSARSSRRGARAGSNRVLVPGGSSGRVGGGGRGAAVRRGDRDRHRRVDPPARRLHRDRRDQADLWPLLALGGGGVRVVARPGGADGARRHRLRDPAWQSMAGFDPKDATSLDVPVPDWAGGLTGDLRGVRVGVPKEYRLDGIDPEIAAMWDAGVGVAHATAGATVVDVSLPHTKYALPAYYIVAPAEASSNLARYDGVRYGLRVAPDGGSLDAMYEATRAAGFGPEVKRRIMIGTYVLSAGFYDAYYRQAQKVRTLIARDFERGMGDVRRPADPDRAERRLLARRQGRPARDVFERRLHRAVVARRAAGDVGARRADRDRAATRAPGDRPAARRGGGAQRGFRARARRGVRRPPRAVVVARLPGWLAGRLAVGWWTGRLTPARRALAGEGLRFVAVGLANTATTFATVWGLRHATGASVGVASAAGYAVGMVQGFVLNRGWTFAGRDGRIGRQATGFVAVNVVCGLVFTGANILLHRVVGLAASTLLANALVPPLSFILYRQFVFRR